MNEKDALGNAQANNVRIYSLMFDMYEKVRNSVPEKLLGMYKGAFCIFSAASR